MKSRSSMIVVGLAITLGAGTWGVGTLRAQQPGFKRVELQRHDLAVPNREAVLARAELAPGAGTPRHTHPGEEVAYVLEGPVLLEVEGKPPVTLKSGEVFFIPAGQVHAAKNAGPGPAKVLSTYIIEKGKPLATPVK